MTSLLSSPDPRLKLSQFASASSESNSSVKNSDAAGGSSVGGAASVAGASVTGASVGSGSVAVGRISGGSWVGGDGCVGGVPPPLRAEQASPTSITNDVKKNTGCKGFI